jgi:hypothetical protein
VVTAHDADEAFRLALLGSRMLNKVVVHVAPLIYDKPSEWTVVVSGTTAGVVHEGRRRPWERT